MQWNSNNTLNLIGKNKREGELCKFLFLTWYRVTLPIVSLWLYQEIVKILRFSQKLGIYCLPFILHKLESREPWCCDLFLQHKPQVTFSLPSRYKPSSRLCAQHCGEQLQAPPHLCGPLPPRPSLPAQPLPAQATTTEAPKILPSRNIFIAPLYYKNPLPVPLPFISSCLGTS